MGPGQVITATGAANNAVRGDVGGWDIGCTRHEPGQATISLTCGIGRSRCRQKLTCSRRDMLRCCGAPGRDWSADILDYPFRQARGECLADECKARSCLGDWWTSLCVLVLSTMQLAQPAACNPRLHLHRQAKRVALARKRAGWEQWRQRIVWLQEEGGQRQGMPAGRACCCWPVLVLRMASLAESGLGEDEEIGLQTSRQRPRRRRSAVCRPDWRCRRRPQPLQHVRRPLGCGRRLWQLS